MEESSTVVIRKATDVLVKNLPEIRSVEEWAEAVGYRNAANFSREFRNHFGKRPKVVMVDVRLQKAINLLRENPEISCYEVARAIGKKDEKALHRYFITHTHKPPSVYRQKMGTKKGDLK